MENFADRVSRRILNTSNLIVGIDPDFALFPQEMKSELRQATDVCRILEDRLFL